MKPSSMMHVVVRWGTSVLVVRNVDARDAALRRGLPLSDGNEVAGAIEDAAPFLSDEEMALRVGPYVVEASAGIEPPTPKRRRMSRLAVAAVWLSLFVHGAFVVALIASDAPEGGTDEAPKAARRADRIA